MSSGSYFPGPVRAVEIPKDHGLGIRTLGVPNTADRVAQTAAAMLLEERLEPIFHQNSYGYRPGRSAHDALAVTRERCWRRDWVFDLDIRAFFDSVPHDLLLKAVAHHTDERWVLLYIASVAESAHADAGWDAGRLGRREPRRGLRSLPLLANLFMHYAFDTWMVREFPECPFERYADDIVAHCDTEGQARASSGRRRRADSGRWVWNCIPRRRRSCFARTRTGRGTRSTPASISSAIPSGHAWSRVREATL